MARSVLSSGDAETSRRGTRATVSSFMLATISTRGTPQSHKAREGPQKEVTGLGSFVQQKHRGTETQSGLLLGKFPEGCSSVPRCLCVWAGLADQDVVDADLVEAVSRPPF